MYSACSAVPHTQPPTHGQQQKSPRWHANPQDGYAISAYFLPASLCSCLPTFLQACSYTYLHAFLHIFLYTFLHAFLHALDRVRLRPNLKLL